MTRASAIAVAALMFFIAGCREEPTIVIKFEPNDMSGVKVADMSARKPADLATAPADLAVVSKIGAGKTGGKVAAECKAAADCVIEPIRVLRLRQRR